VLVIVVPGPDTAMVTKHAFVAGRRGAMFASLGVVIGLATWTVAAAVGLAALLRASSVAFFALKIAGAAYLIWVGIQMLRDRNSADPHHTGRRTSRKAFRQGILSDLGNPKIAVFFTSFLPQFIHGSGNAFGPLLLLGALFCLITFAWLTLYSLVIGHGASLLRRPRVRRALDRFTGAVFVALGIRLALEHR
jgi:RhtB (resistance to homoserine/threonine) family protein